MSIVPWGGIPFYQFNFAGSERNLSNSSLISSLVSVFPLAAFIVLPIDPKISSIVSLPSSIAVVLPPSGTARVTFESVN
jgi:hypothetical protein